MQDDIYKPDYYSSLLDFRELTLQRLKHFVKQKFFSVFDYLQGKPIATSCTAVDFDALFSSVISPSADVLGR